MRQTQLLWLLAVLAIVGCSRDNPDRSSTSIPKSLEPTTSAARPPTSLSFESSLEKAGSRLANTDGTDLCAVYESQSDSSDFPTTPAGVKSLVEYQQEFFAALAGAAPEAIQPAVLILVGASAAFATEAQAANYSPSILSPDTPPKAFAEPQAVQASEDLATFVYEQCE